MANPDDAAPGDQAGDPPAPVERDTDDTDDGDGNGKAPLTVIDVRHRSVLQAAAPGEKRWIEKGDNGETIEHVEIEPTAPAAN
ncbi:hypothetical protein QCN29_34045 [Streptomyces sp. HNM0663]|uniref:Uncharacterized protein n=1 Tax=Streptomyces chengmaiensis TaxID=3040919 RepID=A0ABT6HYA3_9ACTN|nr:hypothetical protein [Streptomyces chengmaiensis]MDH2393698.1 hypothetical protein [Streptomyces chengmaiensis]